MTHARRHQPLRSRRVRALIAGLALLAIVLSLTVVGATDAGWKSSDASEASFTAVEIEPVQKLQCTDSDDGLIPDLLKTEVQLHWDRPNVDDDVALEYVVTWDGGLLGGSGSRLTSEDSYVYKAGGLLSLGRVNFTVSAKTVDGDWIATPQKTSASTITVLGIPVLLGCN